MSGWSKSVVNELARRFAQREKGRWTAYVDDVRSAMIDAEVLRVVLGMELPPDVGVRLEDVRSLRHVLREALEHRHAMRSPAH